MNMHAWFLAFVLFTLVGCASHSPNPTFDDNYLYPDGWSKPIEMEDQADECILIDGFFYSKGNSNSTISERFANPIFELSFFDLRKIADESNLFKITFDIDDKKLFFDIFSADNKVLATGNYKQYSRCEAGWVVYESQSKAGSGDSPVKSTNSITRMSLAQDGSLIVHSHYEAVWRKYLFGSETRVSDIWYKFERVEVEFSPSKLK